MELAIVAGEACPRDLVERHHAQLPNTPLSNEYGPTETTVWATLEICHVAEPGPVAIGRHIAGTRAYEADHSQRLCQPRLTAELLITVPGVARGYVGPPDLPPDRFIHTAFHAP